MPDHPFFFLAYARENRSSDDRKVIDRFFNDLETELAARLAWSDPIGFMDTRNIENGDDWPQELREALEHCWVFVPILSRRYFNREACGQEWTFFERRLDAVEQATGTRPRSIQPVLFVGPHLLTQVPEVVGRIQNHGDWAPPRYNEAGLRPLILLDEDGEYQQFLHAFVERLVALHDRHGALPRIELPPIEALSDAFIDGDDHRVPAARLSSPRRVQFFYVAGTRAELAEVRSYVECYGADEADWQPYMPDLEEPVGLLATRVASDENLVSRWIPLDGGLIERLDKARAENAIAVLVVDAWTARLPRYRSLMDELDRRSYFNVVILVPSNPLDPERNSLLGAGGVESVFVNRALSSDREQFIHDIGSPRDLRQELARSLQLTIARIEKGMTIQRRAAGAGPGSLPLLGDG